jgi:hypothetical protein
MPVERNASQGRAVGTGLNIIHEGHKGHEEEEEEKEDEEDEVFL